jgi:hypothetical protein
MFGRDELAKNIRLFFEEKGIDPFYAVTVFSILVTLSYWQQFKNWDKIEGWRRRLAGSALFASVTFSIISFLRLIGAISF